MTDAVSRNLRFAVLAAMVLAAACGSGGEEPAEPVDVKFVPQVVDFLDNVGISPSIALDGEGNPHLSYVGIPEELEEGELPIARPVTAPVVPAVLTAVLQESIWSHDAAVESTLSATDPVNIPLSVESSTAIAVDEQGTSHVACTQDDGLYYGEKSEDDFGDPQLVVEGTATGVSIAADGDGNPWLGDYLDGTVRAATLEGENWSETEVSSIEE